MEIEVIEVSVWDLFKGVRKGMKGYIETLAFEYLGRKCYRVHLYDYGMFHLYENAMKVL